MHYAANLAREGRSLEAILRRVGRGAGGLFRNQYPGALQFPLVGRSEKAAVERRKAQRILARGYARILPGGCAGRPCKASTCTFVNGAGPAHTFDNGVGTAPIGAPPPLHGGEGKGD
jgi:hypothetical protein